MDSQSLGLGSMLQRDICPFQPVSSSLNTSHVDNR